jgi:hypothetical protein
MKIPHKLVTKHDKNCYSVRMVKNGDWHSAWFLTDRTVYKNKNCVGKGSTACHVFICNSTECKATMLISQNVLLSLLPPV